MAVKPIPPGYEGVTPYLVIKGAAAAIDFYKKAFGAVELFRIGHGDHVGHAEIKIGGGIVMLADECPQSGGVSSPGSVGGTTAGFVIYVENVDAFFDRALSGGAKVVKPLQDQFYGDRSGTVADPFGHVWTFATHKEDVSPEEMNRRVAQWMQTQQKQ